MIFHYLFSPFRKRHHDWSNVLEPLKYPFDFDWLLNIINRQSLQSLALLPPANSPYSQPATAVEWWVTPPYTLTPLTMVIILVLTCDTDTAT